MHLIETKLVLTNSRNYMAAKKNNKQTDAVTKENVVAAEPVKQKKRNLKKGEAVASATPASKPVVEMEKIIAREEAASQSVSDRLDRIASVPVSPFAKYDEVYNKSEEEDDDDDDVKIAPRKPAVTLPVERKPAATRSRSPKNMACEPSSMPQHIISDDKAAISKLTKGNVWDTDVEEIYNMLLEGKHTEHWAEKRVKYMNIIRPVYDVEFIDMDDNKTIASLEESNFKIFAYPERQGQVTRHCNTQAPDKESHRPHDGEHLAPEPAGGHRTDEKQHGNRMEGTSAANPGHHRKCVLCG